MLRKLVRRFAVVAFYAPPEVLSFVGGPAGREYGIGLAGKLGLMFRVLRNSTRPGAASSFLEQLALVRAALSVPKSVPGDVAEFGCYKGLSSATLSLACRRTGRRLLAFDSFAGLPDPDGAVTNIGDGKEVVYKKGDYAGTLDEVRANVAAYGDPGVCEFVQGYFDDTLPGRPAGERYALVFEDADLPSSVRTVIRFAWPKLQDGCYFFCHEARDLEVMKIFFDDRFWAESGAAPAAPGMIGSGLGLPYSTVGSCMGYVQKRGTGPTPARPPT